MLGHNSSRNVKIKSKRIFEGDAKIWNQIDVKPIIGPFGMGGVFMQQLVELQLRCAVEFPMRRKALTP